MQLPDWASLVPVEEVVYDVGFNSKRWIKQSVHIEGEAPDFELVIKVHKREPDPEHAGSRVIAVGGYTIRCSSTLVRSAEVGYRGDDCPVIEFEMVDAVAKAHPPAAPNSNVSPLLYFNDEATRDKVRDMMLNTH